MKCTSVHTSYRERKPRRQGRFAVRVQLTTTRSIEHVQHLKSSSDKCCIWYFCFTTVQLASGFFVRRNISYPSTPPPYPPPPCTLYSLRRHATDRRRQLRRRPSQSTRVWAAPSHKRAWQVYAASLVLITATDACSSSNNSRSRSTVAMPPDQPNSVNT